jgi:hypothetical protein
MEIRSDRTYRFAVPASAVWAAMADVDSFTRWWPWLQEFDGRRLAPGQVWTCAVRPPLPYVVRFRLTVGAVDPCRTVTATVDGDIRGRARVDLAEDAGTGGSRVRLRSDLSPAHRWLRAVAAVARPAVRFGHDWVLDTGARQFAAPDLPAPAGGSATPPEPGGSRAAAG